jgi:hypothetical protein
MNGAGLGGRLVANRRNTASASQLGSREQRRYDLNVAFSGAGVNDEQIFTVYADNTEYP